MKPGEVPELGVQRAATEQLGIDLGAGADEAEPLQPFGQVAGPLGVDAGVTRHRQERLPRVPVGARRRDRDRVDVVLLDHQHAARPHGCRESPQHGVALGEMDQEQARVDEVERVARQVVGDEVHLADLDAGHEYLLEQADVEVDRQHAAARPDAPGEPACERPVAGAGVEAAPASPNAERLRTPDARRGVAGLQQLEPAAGERPRVRERVSPGPGAVPAGLRRCSRSSPAVARITPSGVVGLIGRRPLPDRRRDPSGR
jgi:hypothetical protein